MPVSIKEQLLLEKQIRQYRSRQRAIKRIEKMIPGCCATGRARLLFLKLKLRQENRKLQRQISAPRSQIVYFDDVEEAYKQARELKAKLATRLSEVREVERTLEILPGPKQFLQAISHPRLVCRWFSVRKRYQKLKEELHLMQLDCERAEQDYQQRLNAQGKAGSLICHARFEYVRTVLV